MTLYSTHLGKRLKERKMNRAQVDATLSHPDTKTPSKGGYKYTKNIQNKKVTVITTQVQHNQELVVSAWIDPPYPGTKDAKKQAVYKAYQSAKGIKKFFLAIRLALLS